MKGTYFLGNQAFETRELPGHDLAADEVLIRVAACGVCGTDVHLSLIHIFSPSEETNPWIEMHTPKILSFG